MEDQEMQEWGDQEVKWLTLAPPPTSPTLLTPPTLLPAWEPLTGLLTA